MSKKIRKHLKVTSSCSNCERDFKNNVVVTVDKDFSISDLSTDLIASNNSLKECKRCGASIYDVSFTFYHEEKIKING